MSLRLLVALIVGTCLGSACGGGEPGAAELSDACLTGCERSLDCFTVDFNCQEDCDYWVPRYLEWGCGREYRNQLDCYRAVPSIPLCQYARDEGPDPCPGPRSELDACVAEASAR